ncbi:MAG: hypothetical protein RJA99_3981 [Pseudomonadota bacterium]|jgi:hypothetical protein
MPLLLVHAHPDTPPSRVNAALLAAAHAQRSKARAEGRSADW